ncbi:MAG TPA: putative quinol monooxygenase [Blastocatellia bacterium]|nr:putative quinol monooxygenase [Blastocatellia bacterium]
MNQEQITVIAHLEVKPGTEEAFKQELSALIAATRAEAACINYDFHQSVDEPVKFVAYENWTGMAGLEEHSRSAHIRTFRKNCAEMFAQPAKLTIWKMISDPAGK